MSALEQVEFDQVFDVREGGAVVERDDLHAPTVWHDDVSDIEIDGAGWEPLTGFTGQYGYHGAVLHASETFSAGLLRHVLETPGTYVLVVVGVLPDDEEDDPEPAGWAVLRRVTA